MNFDQAAVFSIIACAMVFFIWGRFRYDLVAVAALLAGVVTGVVQPDHAFSGFGHAAVITVAAVLVISQALQNSGIVEYLVRFLAPARTTAGMQVAAGSTLGAALSCVMNNVGALALMLPVTMRNAYKAERSPSLVLIPLSFASLLGGLITLIGTPPNIVVSAYRAELSGEPFGMFDFTPVGLVLATAGLVYLATVGWRLLPELVSAGGEDSSLIHVESYTLESNVPKESPFAGLRVRELEAQFEGEVAVMAIIRKDMRQLAPRPIERIREEDILILQGDPSLIQPLADGVKLGELGHEIENDAEVRSEDVGIVEAVLMPNSEIEGRSMRGLRMHDRFGVNLLALARHGRPTTARLKNIRFKTGDVLLMQGEMSSIDEALHAMGCLPLAGRSLQVAQKGSHVLVPVAIFGAAIIAAASGFVSVPIAFVAAVLLLVLTSTITLGDVYESIEWPIIVLIGALIPIGEALQHTGGTGMIAGAMVDIAGDVPVWAMVGLLLVTSMWLSDLVHNTPTAILMAPVAASIATALELNPDGFLMAVAIGAASPYLTPIGHQSNTLVMGPGGYRFIDYTRVGAPLEVLIVLIGVPMIMWVWPP